MTLPRNVIADLELVLGVRGVTNRDKKPAGFGPDLPIDTQDEAQIGVTSFVE